MKTKILITLAAAIALPLNALAKDSYSGDHAMVSDEVIAHQRENLEKNTYIDPCCQFRTVKLGRF